MAYVKASDIRRGMVVTIDGNNYIVADFEHRTPGNLRAFVQAKLKNMVGGGIIDRRLRSDEQVEIPYVESKEFEYLYSAGTEHVFMDVETFDQLHFDQEMVGDSIPYMLPNTRVTVKYVDNKAVSVELPTTVDLTVTDTPPTIKGATVTSQYKEATTETGLRVMVPPFIEPGEKIRVDTRSGEYVERIR